MVLFGHIVLLVNQTIQVDGIFTQSVCVAFNRGSKIKKGISLTAFRQIPEAIKKVCVEGSTSDNWDCFKQSIYVVITILNG